MRQARDPHGLLAAEHRQPDQLSCGACVGVVAAALLDDALAASLRESPELFRTEVLGLHRRLTGVRGTDGRAQLPWPRLLGTPPWALARHLAETTDRPQRVRLLRGPTGRRTRTRVARALEQGVPVAVYVGSVLVPRHVVLAVPGTARGPLRETMPPDVALYDPASGRVRTERLGPDGHHRLSRGWPVPWFAVLPRDC